MTDTEALACGPNAFDDRSAAPRMRPALIFHDRLDVAAALSGVIQMVDPVRRIEWFDDGFALTDAFGRDPTAVVLVGYRSGSRVATQATDLLLGLFPAAWVVGYGGADCAELLVAAVSGGVRGVMLWDPVEPVTGRRAAPTRPRRRPVDDRNAGPTLTARERQILQQIAEGQSNPDIAAALALSEEAVKFQARKIYRKLGARDRAHAVAIGLRLHYLA